MHPWEVHFEPSGRLRISRHGRAPREASLVVSHRAFEIRLGEVMPEALADLMEVAAVIHAVDRLAPRESRSWTRHLRVRLSVRRTDLWSHLPIIESLTDVLSYFTEDKWELEFAGRGISTTPPVQRLLPMLGPVRVCLFSGGLDSLIGLAAAAMQDGEGTLLPVSVGLSSRLLHLQRELLAQAARRCRMVPLIVPFRLHQRIPARVTEEKSQRTRGFLFGSYAAIAAWLAEAEEILVFENGVGAINLPLTPSQVGAQSTRSTHPVGLHKLGRFLSLLTESEIRFRLPHLFATKGEGCRLLAGSRFSDLAAQTVSCDSFPLRIEEMRQCGVCSSCLLRRQALQEGAIQENSRTSKYRFDVLDVDKTIPQARLLGLKEMLWQIHRLRLALRADRPWQDLVTVFPSLREVAEEVANDETDVIEAQERLVDLYRRYCAEWMRYPTGLSHIAVAA
jgi:7-cyano-7-deazaguanine synthase in queuosine biosynthesis